MVKDDILPVTPYIAPPSTPDEAIQRVAELSAGSLLGLTGSIFQGLAQFTHAMGECRYNARVDILMDSGRTKTYKGTVIDSHGYEYKIILNATGDYHLQVVNVKLSKVGPTGDPKSIQEVLDVLKDEPKDEG